MTMEQILMAATAVDLGAVLGLGWLVVRNARERALGDVAQRDALERLRGELQHLIEEADRRARALDGSMAAGEARPRGGVQAGPEESPRTAGRTGTRRAAAPARAAAPVRLERSWIEEEDAAADDDLLREALVRDDAPDPAELRLRRELELSLGTMRQA